MEKLLESIQHQWVWEYQQVSVLLIPIQRAVKSNYDIIETGFVKRAIMGISYMERNPSIVESEKSGSFQLLVLVY